MKYKFKVKYGVMMVVEQATDTVVCIGVNKWKLKQLTDSLNEGNGFGGYVPSTLWVRPMVIR